MSLTRIAWLVVGFLIGTALGRLALASDVPPYSTSKGDRGIIMSQGSYIPPQAQASTMAVPEPGLEYVSALLVVHCRQVEALVLIDSHGEQHPFHGKEATMAQVLTILSPVPADKVTQVTITCERQELGM